MKKLILFAAILFGAHTASAQINEGNVMVGGTFADFNADFKNQTSLSLTPKAAWFIKDGLALGAYGNFGFTHINGGQTTYNYGFGPLARYYMINDRVGKTKNLTFFWEANVGFDGSSKKGKTVGDYRLAGASNNGLGFGVGPGVTYFVTPNIGLEALVKYNGTVGFGSETYVNKLSVGFGFQIYLPGSKVKKEIKSL